MSKNNAIIIQFVLLLTTLYRSGAQKINIYKRDAFVTSWRFHNRAWQPQRHDRLPETSGTLWIHRGALTNQRCSLATGCGIILQNSSTHGRILTSHHTEILHKVDRFPTVTNSNRHWSGLPSSYFKCPYVQEVHCNCPNVVEFELGWNNTQLNDTRI